jgi:tetratricopeptide (TPR) repeat protein
LQIEKQSEQQTRIENRFIVPYQQNFRFTGRKAFMETLKERLFVQVQKQYNHRVALYGMGGVGKTQIALEYVYSHEASYERIYWISAVDQASLLSGYRQIAEEVGIVVAETSNLIDTAKSVILWLRREQNWLVVIDNLDDITIADGFLPENGPQKHTLITTRNPDSEGIPAEGLEVPLFDHEDAVALLSIGSRIDTPPNSTEKEQADTIVKELQCLPLAVEHAAAYVRVVTGDFAGYRQEYDKNRSGVNLWLPPGNKQYPYSVATTFSMSFAVAQKNNLHAAHLLRLLSFLNPDGILIEFLVAGVDALGCDLQRVVSVPGELAKALLELEKFSLIRWDRRKKLISLHRLVQTVIRDGLFGDEATLILTTIVHLCDQSFPTELTKETRTRCRLYQDQVLEPLLRTDTILTENAADIKRRVGNFLCNDGKYNDGEKLLRQAVEILTQLLGIENPKTLAAMHDLALSHGQRGHMVEAARLQEEVLEKRRGILGDDHPDTLCTMLRLGSTYRQQGRTAALKLHLEVVKKRITILGEDHPDTLSAMHTLSWTYLQQGHTREAAQLQDKVLKKRRRILGDEHHDMLATEHNLAWIYLQQGQTEEAINLQEEVLKKRRRILGEEHPHTLSTMDNLGSMYLQQGRTLEAAKLGKIVLKERRRILGEEHPYTLGTMDNLGLTYVQQGRILEAEQLQKDVLEKKVQILGEEHPHTLSIMQNLSLTYLQQGRTAEAIKLQNKAAEIKRHISAYRL